MLWHLPAWLQTLENRDVPLIQRWSNPLKVRLTAAGMALGARLYRHAVEAGKMSPHPQVSGLLTSWHTMVQPCDTLYCRAAFQHTSCLYAGFCLSTDPGAGRCEHAAGGTQSWPASSRSCSSTRGRERHGSRAGEGGRECQRRMGGVAVLLGWASHHLGYLGRWVPVWGKRAGEEHSGPVL